MRQFNLSTCHNPLSQKEEGGGCFPSSEFFLMLILQDFHSVNLPTLCPDTYVSM